MNDITRSQAITGSITPQLEGASRSESHPKRAPEQTNPKPEKDGAKHE